MQIVVLGCSLSGNPGFFTGGFMALPLSRTAFADCAADASTAKAHAARLGFKLEHRPQAYHDLLKLAAGMVAETIVDPEARASFEASTKFRLRRWDFVTPTPEALTAAAWAVEQCETLRPTPCGAVDLWGAIEQHMEQA
mgnify:FL=1